jgi:hypothetical protein
MNIQKFAEAQQADRSMAEQNSDQPLAYPGVFQMLNSL